MRSKLAFFIVLLSLGGGAQAQVYRCEGPSGKTSYSDAPCPKGQTEELVERKKTTAEIQREREQAAQANKARLEKESNELRQRQQEQDAALKESQQATAANTPLNLANTPACHRARKDMDWINHIHTLSDEKRRARMNAAITEVNAACGTQTELIPEPVPPPSYWPCYGVNCVNPQNQPFPGHAY